MNAEKTKNEIESRLGEHVEWLLLDSSSAKSFPLRSGELELFVEREKLFLEFVGDKGFETWRVAGYEFQNGKISLALTRNFQKENVKIQLVPRISSAELSETAELARIEKARQIAALITRSFPKTKLIRVELNRETGRFAQIIFENPGGRQIAAIADVSASLTPEILISTAILWLEKLQSRSRNTVAAVWILAEKKQAQAVQKLHALLRENWQSKIELFEISRAGKAETEELKKIPSLEISDLWRGGAAKSKKNPASEDFETSETARKIVDFAPDEIDCVMSRNGQTLRFLGLPFARVRKVPEKEKIWFGVEANRRILHEKSFDEFVKLIEDLKTYRRFDSPNKHHIFYARAPESWLEALLRRNIKLLDANLILSPLHQQFRAEREKIDLLALRKDGRLVIIELKIGTDREMVFQAADYWRKIEGLRKSGALQKAKIFGTDQQISDAPALVYLVAPTLSFHRDFAFLASTVSPEIEIYRFSLNEDWRRRAKVLARK